MSELQLEPVRPTKTVPGLLEIDDVAELLHISRSLLAKWRMLGRGPRFMKVGRRILYASGEVSRWLEAQERSSTLG
jgi:predicted DNA-binding transcriptional regulator AlpA